MLYTVGLLPRAMPEQVPFAYEIFKKGKERFVLVHSFSDSASVGHRNTPVSSFSMLPVCMFSFLNTADAFYPQLKPTAQRTNERSRGP